MHSRFWYLSLIACYRNLTTCEWETSALPRPDIDLSKSDCRDSSRPCVPMRMHYDIWMVNGVPRLRDYYRFEHQFSFEYHDIFEIYLTFGVLYLFLGGILHVSWCCFFTILGSLKKFLMCVICTWLYIFYSQHHARSFSLCGYC